VHYLDNSVYNFYICTRSDHNNLHELRDRLGLNFNKKYNDQIVYAESFGINPNLFDVSLPLYIACLVKMGATRIIMFGADGGGTLGNNPNSYYKPGYVVSDKMVAHNNLNYNMTGDTNNVNINYNRLMQTVLGFMPTVLNCSPVTRYTVFPVVTYDNVVKML
jgi:hypothetical protein